MELTQKYMAKRRHGQAFLIALAVSAVMFLPIIIFDGGVYTFYGDYNVQQIPFYQLAHRAVRSGDVFWSWYTDLGANFIGSYSFYLLFSPFFWLTLPFPNSFVPYLMGPLLMLKHACAAYIAYFYIRRFVKNTQFAVIGGLLYAFSGFMIYNIFFNHFHEVVVFFPLLLIGIERLIEGKRGGVLAAAVFLNAIVNYWFFIGEVVFVILYFCIRLTDREIRSRLKLFTYVAAEAVIGALMAMFVLIPSALTVIGNPRTGADSMLSGWELIYHSSPQRYLNIISVFFFPPDLPSRPNFFPDHGAKWSSLAAWLPLIGMTGAIAFLQSVKNHWLRKMIAACTIFAMVRGLNSVFILMNGSYYTRWFYMFILMMCLASVIALERADRDVDYPRGIRWSLVITLCFIPVGLIPKETDESYTIGLEAYKPEFWGWVLIALAALGIVWQLWRKFGKTAQFPKMLIIGVACVSAVYGAIYLNVARNYSGTSRFVVETALPGQGKIDLPEEDGTFARADFYESMENLGMYWELPNIQAFHSIVPVSIMEFYPTVGVTRDVSSKPQTGVYELRPFLSVKWLFIPVGQENQEPMPGFSLYDTQQGFNIYENDNYIPMGFTYDRYISSEYYMEISEGYRSKVLLQALVLNEEQIERHGDILEPFGEVSYGVSYEDIESDIWERKLGSGYSFETDSRGFTSRIDLERENLVFFSVPYEEGWTAYVNGEPVPIEKVNIGFMAVRAPAGDNTIRFEYMTPGLIPGLFLAGAGLILFIGYLALIYVRERRARAEESERLALESPIARIEEDTVFPAEEDPLEGEAGDLLSRYLSEEAAGLDSDGEHEDISSVSPQYREFQMRETDTTKAPEIVSPEGDLQSISTEKTDGAPSEIGITEEFIRRWLEDLKVDDEEPPAGR